MSSPLKISKAVSLGFHTMCYLAENSNGLISSKEVAEEFNASQHHLARVVLQLVRMGLIHSARGPKGGIRLARPAQDITLLDVYTALEGPISAVGCFLDNEECRYDRCIFNRLQEIVFRDTEEYLRKTTLRDLIDIAHED